MVKAHKILMSLFMTVPLFGVLFVPMTDAQMTPPIQMPPAPEIEITAITFSDTDAIDGQDITITVTIENMNSTMAVNNITLSLYLDYGIVQNFTIASLAGGESASFDYVWNSESGTHNVTAMLVVEEIPLPDTQTSEKLVVGLGNIGSIILALLVVALGILLIAMLPSIIKKVRK